MAVYLAEEEIEEVMRQYDEGLITTPEMIAKLNDAVYHCGR